MAPPLTFTLLVSQPRSLLTAQACAAKASLASTRSRSPIFQPAFLSAARDAGMRPGHDARQRHLAELGRFARLHQYHRGGAVIDAGRIAGGYSAFLVESGPQFADRIKRRAVLGIFVGVDNDVALAGFYGNGRDLVLEPAGLLRRFSLVL